MKTFDKTVVIGRVNGVHYGYKHGQSLEVTVEVELRQEQKGLELSICGNVWNKRKTDVLCCGQNNDTLLEHLNKHEFKTLNESFVTLRKLFAVWERWHLNGTRAGCEHQRKLLRDKTKHPDHDYTKLIEFAEFKKCPECGYSYGSQWLHEELPEEVIKFVTDFVKNGKRLGNK